MRRLRVRGRCREARDVGVCCASVRGPMLCHGAAGRRMYRDFLSAPLPHIPVASRRGHFDLARWFSRRAGGTGADGDGSPALPMGRLCCPRRGRTRIPSAESVGVVASEDQGYAYAHTPESEVPRRRCSFAVRLASRCVYPQSRRARDSDEILSLLMDEDSRWPPTIAELERE
jgi:hypothetical protein